MVSPKCLAISKTKILRNLSSNWNKLHKRLVFTRFKSRILLIHQVCTDPMCLVTSIKLPPLDRRSQSLRTRSNWHKFTFRTNMLLSSKVLVPVISGKALMSMT